MTRGRQDLPRGHPLAPMSAEGEIIVHTTGNPLCSTWDRPRWGHGEEHELTHLVDGYYGALTMTIDVGAPSNLISELLVSQYPTEPSSGRRGGRRYTAANGSTMTNRGGEDVRFMTANSACLR